MRVTRSLLLFFVVALVTAGCASRPVAYVQGPNGYYVPAAQNGYAPVAPRGYVQAAPSGYAPAAPNGYVAAAPNGIDNTVYGSPAAPAPALVYAPRPAPVYAPRYAPASAPVYASTYAPASVAAYAPTVREGPYTLDSGDRLRIVVFGQDGLTNSYAVDASGHIAMPLIGSVLARGTTTDELSIRIAEKLRDGYIREPHVAVEIEAYRPFFILGEVTAPGQYPYVANMTAETAVAIAGGFGPRAYRQTIIVNRIVNGQPVRMPVPLNYPLRPGDTVNVQERWF